MRKKMREVLTTGILIVGVTACAWAGQQDAAENPEGAETINQRVAESLAETARQHLKAGRFDKAGRSAYLELPLEPVDIPPRGGVPVALG